MNFKHLDSLIKELKANSSTLNKIKILQEYGTEEVKKILYYAHQPFYNYHVTSANCKKRSELLGRDYDSLFDLLDDLRTRRISGHDAIGAVNTFCNKNPNYKDIIFCIIDKDLKTRTGVKIINKAFPNLVPEFEVAKAENFSFDLVDFYKENWYASRKMDGVRCIVMVDEHGKATSFSRTGNVFNVFKVIEDNIEKLNLKNVVFDGEVCCIENDKEDFQEIMKMILRKNYTIKNPAYKIFDFLDIEDFNRRKSNSKLSFRLNNLEKVLPKDHPVLQILSQNLIKDLVQLKDSYAEALQNGWEGLMLRKDAPYKGKRSKDILKYKEFHDAEYVVDDVEFGPFRYVLDGEEVEETMLSCVIISHKNHTVRVGSGFTLEQRKDLYVSPDKILGKTILVQYFEETFNQNGGISLRFPTFKFLYGKKRDV